jgi:TetR/AcrR family transcriptional repressor of nem operon
VRTKRGEKEKLRALILDRTVAYLKTHGRSGAGTGPMMRHAGLTRGALYSHFASKDDLFARAVCHDLARLEDTLAKRFREGGRAAIKMMIEDHLSEASLTDVEGGCVFTSLATDMQRSKPEHRKLYEAHMDRIYKMFADALRGQFPHATSAQRSEKAFNLYSGLVGTLAMARTMKDPNHARRILSAGKRFLIEQFAAHS